MLLNRLNGKSQIIVELECLVAYNMGNVSIYYFLYISCFLFENYCFFQSKRYIRYVEVQTCQLKQTKSQKPN
jgi:hypothetical protein